MKYGF